MAPDVSRELQVSPWLHYEDRCVLRIVRQLCPCVDGQRVQLVVAQQGQGGRVIRQRRAEAEAGASGYSDCRSVSGNCVCTAGLFADSLFVASTYGEGSPTVAAQYMVNQLAQADSNFRRTDFGGLTG